MKYASILQNILLMILSPVIFLLIMELATRVFWQYEVEEKEQGVIMKGPNREYVYKGVHYKTNSHGLRYRELNQGGSENKRILALGDSFVWGQGLAEQTLVTTKLECMLGDQYPGVQVINGGISGYNTKDEYEQLVRLTPIYKPSDVLVFFFTNDVLVKRNRKKGHDSGRSWKYEFKEYLRRNSKFFAFLYYQYKAHYAATFGVPRGLLASDYIDLDDSKPGWVSFKQAVLNIRDFCKEQGMGLHFIIIPTLTTLNENYPYIELHEEVKKFVIQLDIPLIDLFPVYAPYQPVDLWVSLENTHWNDKATTLAAEEIVTNISQRLSGPVIKVPY